jgi:hypothetical protein
MEGAAVVQVVAARGQTMSVSVYPERGMILFGSESVAVKAALGGGDSGLPEDVGKGAYRLDLNDLGGEVMLLDWSDELRAPKIFSGGFAAQLLNMEFQEVCQSTWRQSSTSLPLSVCIAVRAWTHVYKACPVASGGYVGGGPRCVLFRYIRACARGRKLWSC